MKLLELTPAQKVEWEATRTALMWSAPAFTHLLFTILDYRARDNYANAFWTDEVEIAATDGWRLLLNPTTFLAIPLKDRVFIVAHEIMHCIWAHPATMKHWQQRGYVVGAKGDHIPYHHEVLNIAADLIINDLLIDSKIGTFPAIGGLHDKNLATAVDALNEVYERVYNKTPKQPQGGNGQGQGQPGQGNSPSNGQGAAGQMPSHGGKKAFDTMMDPDGHPEDKPADAHANGTAQGDGRWRQAIAEAAALGKAQGQLPAGIARVFAELTEPKVDWSGAIRGAVARRVGSSDSSWRRPDRRMIVRDIYSPGRSGHGAGTIALVGDTSGSMTDTEIGVILRELRGILEDLNPQRVIVIWCDAKVHAVEDVYDASDIPSLRPKGGGGTDFRPPFHWLDDESITPDGMIYVTDGYGTFPSSAPDYPVIWADITGPGRVAYPWGDVINIPRDSLAE